jgi:hypothetical protein
VPQAIQDRLAKPDPPVPLETQVTPVLPEKWAISVLWEKQEPQVIQAIPVRQAKPDRQVKPDRQAKPVPRVKPDRRAIPVPRVKQVRQAKPEPLVTQVPPEK